VKEKVPLHAVVRCTCVAVFEARKKLLFDFTVFVYIVSISVLKYL